MNDLTRFLCCLSVMLLLTVPCGRQEPEVRDKSFLSAAKPAKISDLMHGALVRSSQGGFLMTAFMQPAFLSATERHRCTVDEGFGRDGPLQNERGWAVKDFSRLSGAS